MRKRTSSFLPTMVPPKLRADGPQHTRIAPRSALRSQLRDVRGRARARQRAQERVDVRDLLVAQHFLRIRGHVVYPDAQERAKRLDRPLDLREHRRRVVEVAALPGAA